MDQKTALVLGAGGFIGSHMVTYLKNKGLWVRGVDLKLPEFSATTADEFVVGDLRERAFVDKAVAFKGHRGNFYKDVSLAHVKTFDYVFQFAADMGGAGFVFTGDHDADIMHNSASINLHVAEAVRRANELTGSKKTVVFFSSSACVYPEHTQMDAQHPDCRETTAYPANPDSNYGWEKLFSERLYLAYHKNHGIPVRVARFHNIMGEEGTWRGGREKAPAAICRKIAELPPEGGSIELWGDGLQTRSFLHVSECVEAVWRLVQSDFAGPINIGSEEMVTINGLVDVVARVAGKQVTKRYQDGPTGVRGRNSNNDLVREKLGWDYSMTLEQAMQRMYPWVASQVMMNKPVPSPFISTGADGASPAPR
jgi:GDP-D-mannose 3', 5'-epimerase